MVEMKYRRDYILRFGDSCLVLSQRLSECCGLAPTLEEDVALSNTALDLLGHARLWLSYAGEVEAADRDEDILAYQRDTHEFCNLLLVEQPNGDFAQTLVRQFFFDAWYWFVLRDLKKSQDPMTAEIAKKTHKEVTYHLKRSRQWIVRLGDGTKESHNRTQDAVEELWEYVGEMFEMDEIDSVMISMGVGCNISALRQPWQDYTLRVFEEATLTLPNRNWTQRGGKRGIHTEHLGRILTDMQFLQRAHPNVRW